MIDFAGLLDATERAEFTDDPRPGWAGPALLFGGTQGSLNALSSSAAVLAAGVPFDGTASSRPGAAEGPAAIRQASLVFSNYIDSLGEHEMCDLRTGGVFRYERRDIVDVGDLHVYQADIVKTFRAVASEVRTMAATAAKLLLMGGDHSISFPTFAGWRSAMAAAGRAHRLGYVQVDHHFDFGNESAIHGALYHGSNARRISELPGMLPQRMAFVGVGSVTRNTQLQRLIQDGYHVIGARQVKELGARSALKSTVGALKVDCDAIYLSIDIDVLDCSVAPGTGNVTIGGLSASELFDVLSELGLLPVDAIDITEVAPRYDPSGRTVQIAARLLFETIYRRVVRDAT
jgi:arginase family enzyme